MIRVGRCIDQQLTKITPYYEDFENVMVMTKSSKYGELGPYVLKNDKGQIMENIWQFQKIFEEVPHSVQYYSRWDRTVIWSHCAEKHIDSDGNILDTYYNWRKKGLNNKYPVRYPCGIKHRHKCIGAITDKMLEKDEIMLLDYVESRKQIYLPIYCDLVKKQPLFKTLQNKLLNGKNLLIIEIDGPWQSDLEYYKKKYGVNDDFIVNHTMLANEKNLKIMLNDTIHNYGHGYCLAAALLGLEKKIVEE
jgi:hypothetical protein